MKFTEWTAAGEMQHPVFRGLRTDKKADEVVREPENRGSERKVKELTWWVEGHSRDGQLGRGPPFNSRTETARTKITVRQ